MMEEIITLIIHEAETREGDEMAFKIREVLTEVNLRAGTIANDLSAIRQMETTDATKEEMRKIVLSSHKA